MGRTGAGRGERRACRKGVAHGAARSDELRGARRRCCKNADRDVVGSMANACEPGPSIGSLVGVVRTVGSKLLQCYNFDRRGSRGVGTDGGSWTRVNPGKRSRTARCHVGHDARAGRPQVSTANRPWPNRRHVGHDALAGRTHDALAGRTHDALAGRTHDALAGRTHDALAGRTHDALAGRTHDALAGRTHDALAGRTHDALAGRTRISRATRPRPTRCRDRPRSSARPVAARAPRTRGRSSRRRARRVDPLLHRLRLSVERVERRTRRGRPRVRRPCPPFAASSPSVASRYRSPVTEAALPKPRYRSTATEAPLPKPRAPTPRAPTPRAPTPRAPTPRAPTPRAPTPHAPTPHAPKPHAPTRRTEVRPARTRRRRLRGSGFSPTPSGGYIPGYTGPPPPSGVTQRIFWRGSLMSQVLQCTQFCALICSRLPLPASSATNS